MNIIKAILAILASAIGLFMSMRVKNPEIMTFGLTVLTMSIASFLYGFSIFINNWRNKQRRWRKAWLWWTLFFLSFVTIIAGIISVSIIIGKF